jgi:cytochrome oxidase Cu insertion factor (SCO1/SenC/PrrC family)
MPMGGGTGGPHARGRMVGVMRRIVSLRALALATALMGATAGCRLHTERAPVAARALAPDFSLPAHDGRTVTLGELVAQGPALVVFYRGHW